MLVKFVTTWIALPPNSFSRLGMLQGKDVPDDHSKDDTIKEMHNR